MKKKEAYKTSPEDQIQEEIQCDLCKKMLTAKDLVEISGRDDSTILCSKCAVKLDNLSSVYDDD